MYIAVVGIDGCGKTTVINRIQDSGFDAIFTREPHQYNLVKDFIVGNYHDVVEKSYAFAFDRYVHMRDVIIPYRNAGKNIISDRCYICNLVYQSVDGVDLQWLMDIQPTNLVFPDAVIWLQSNPKIAGERSNEIGCRLKVIQEQYGVVLNSYELPSVPWYPVNVDGNTPDEVYADVAMLIEELMRKKR